VGQECDGVSRKWGRSVRGQEEVGTCVRSQHEVRLVCVWVRRKWSRSVGVSAGIGTGL